MHDIRYDAAHDEILVTNPFAQAILAFRGGANGEEAPIRVIQGPHTGLIHPDRLDVDTLNNEIYIPNGDSILVFPREATGDVAPVRVIRGSATTLNRSRSVGVDPIRNLLVVAADPDDSVRNGAHGIARGSIIIFDRAASGDEKPRRVIKGSKTGIETFGQMRLYPPKGWIIATQTGGEGEEPEGVFVGVWSIHDEGDIPPRWKMGGPKSTLKKPRGVALDAKNRELIVADMRLNAVLTFYFPELY